MTLLNHAGLLIGLNLMAICLYAWNMLGSMLGISGFSKNIYPYLKVANALFLFIEAFYWTIKIFF